MRLGMVGVMDPVDAAESGWTTKRKHSDGGQNRRTNDDDDSKERRGKRRIGPLSIGIAAIFAVTILMALVVMMVGLEVMIESSKKIMKIHKVGGCSACENLDVFGGKNFIDFHRSLDEKGCAKLVIRCGLEKGTEAILQWYNGDQNMGVSFMHEMGQSNVRRMVECNGDGQYELEENGHRGVVTAIDCIVATAHEEL